MNKVVHFEIPSDNVKESAEFFKTVFGWEIQPYDDNVCMVSTVAVGKDYMPKEPGAINGDIFKRTKENAHPSVVMEVVSIEKYLEKIEKAGGKIVKGKTEMGGMGYYASFKDPSNNVLGIWETIKKKK